MKLTKLLFKLFVPNITDMSFKERFKILLETKGKSVRSVADACGLTPATLSRYMNGIHEPDFGSIVKICRYFDVSMDWLAGLTESPRTSTLEKYSEIGTLYSVASDEDKKIINLILDKYKDQ